MRPKVGFKPTCPHTAAGIRIEPPVSLPNAPAQQPATTAAAEPPLDPPGTREDIPRVSGRSEVRILRRHTKSEFMEIRFTDDDGAGISQLRDEGGIKLWRFF